MARERDCFSFFRGVWAINEEVKYASLLFYSSLGWGSSQLLIIMVRWSNWEVRDDGIERKYEGKRTCTLPPFCRCMVPFIYVYGNGKFY